MVVVVIGVAARVVVVDSSNNNSIGSCYNTKNFKCQKFRTDEFQSWPVHKVLSLDE